MTVSKKIGVSFYFNGYDKHFAVIFENINLEKYNLCITNSEIIYYDQKTKRAENGVITSGIYSGKDFLQQTSLFEYHIIHIRILANFKDKTMDSNIILSYDAFCSSDCEIALLCADCRVDFYAKDETIIDTVAKNYTKHYNSDVSFITKETDSRTGFYI